MANIKVLVVAGGGGSSGSWWGGGGGAGGAVYNASFAITPGSYLVTVGDGGTAYNKGYDSVFSTITAYGGGNGGAAGDGGCGGGGGIEGGNTSPGGTGSQGYNGGTGSQTQKRGGGGGGMGGVGQNYAGGGGAGIVNTIYDGTNITYATGGNGRFEDTPANGTEGASNTGNGAEGGSGNGSTGAKGGSGVVIVRYTTADFGTCSGGTMTTQTTETIHKFVLADSGTYLVLGSLTSTNYLKHRGRNRLSFSGVSLG